MRGLFLVLGIVVLLSDDAYGQPPLTQYPTGPASTSVSARSFDQSNPISTEGSPSLLELHNLIERLEPLTSYVENIGTENGKTVKNRPIPTRQELAELVAAILKQRRENLELANKAEIQKLQWQLLRFETLAAATAESYSQIGKTNIWSWRICWTVHLMLFAAVVVAGIEFYRSFKTKIDFTNDNFEMIVKAGEISLKTSVHATILLVTAFAFYFLYLKFVFPIETVLL